jgi:hypothetical protein
LIEKSVRSHTAMAMPMTRPILVFRQAHFWPEPDDQTSPTHFNEQQTGSLPTQIGVVQGAEAMVVM